MGFYGSKCIYQNSTFPLVWVAGVSSVAISCVVVGVSISDVIEVTVASVAWGPSLLITSSAFSML